MLVFDARNTLAGQPGLHVLLVGVSQYAHLSKGTKVWGGNDYGMEQLFSPAITVWQLKELLKNQAGRLVTPPLATIRILISASQLEIDEINEPGFNFSDPAIRATHGNCIAEVRAWRNDAWAHPDGMTLFFFSGHGGQRTTDDIIMLMEDFNDPDGTGLLSKTVNTEHLTDLMGPGAAPPPFTAQSQQVAQKQLYFFDCCRSTFENVRKLNAGASPPTMMDTLLLAKDKRVTPIFAGIPGEENKSVDGKPTLFGQALLDCLREVGGKAVDDGNGGSTWTVTTFSLLQFMKEHLKISNLAYGTEQDCQLLGPSDDLPILELDGPPLTTIGLEIVPDQAVPCAKCDVFDPQTNGPACPVPVPISPHPFSTKLKSGTYYVAVTINPPTPPYADSPRKPYIAEWPEKTWRVNV